MRVVLPFLGTDPCASGDLSMEVGWSHASQELIETVMSGFCNNNTVVLHTQLYRLIGSKSKLRNYGAGDTNAQTVAPFFDARFHSVQPQDV